MGKGLDLLRLTLSIRALSEFDVITDLPLGVIEHVLIVLAVLVSETGTLLARSLPASHFVCCFPIYHT